MKKKTAVVHVQLRLSRQEHDYLKRQSQLCGLKMEPYVKRLILGLEVHPLPPDSYRQVAKELSAIGKNVNQIARVVNSTQSVSQDSIREIRAMLDQLWDSYYGDH